jgi:hypothetical protein
VRARIRAGSRFKRFLCFVVIDIRYLGVPQGEYHWCGDWEVLRRRTPRGALTGKQTAVPQPSSPKSVSIQTKLTRLLHPYISLIFSLFPFIKRPPLLSSGQSSWLQIRRPGFDSRHYRKKKVVGLERGPLSLVSTTEELLDRKVAAPV